MKKHLYRLQPLAQFLKRRWKLLTFLLVLIVGGLIWYQRSATSTADALEFVSPTRQDIINTLEVSGVVDAKEKARLRFLAGGKVVYVGAKEGSWVKRGQTIATIDRATLQKQLQLELNAYQRERNDFEDYQDEIEDDVLDDQGNRAKDNTQLNLNDTVLSVEQQAIAIQNTALSAPFEGLLTIAPATTAGVQLAPTDYFEIIKPDSLVFRAAVDESDIAQILLDLPAQLTLDSYPNETISSKISYIAFTSSESSSGTVFIVEFPLEQTVNGQTVRLGMNGDIAIELGRSTDALTIPLDAIRERDDKSFVDVRTGEETFEEREISVGIITDEHVEVLSGLSESDEVLLP